MLVPLSIVLGYALWERDTPKNEAASTAVAAGVTLVPEGLILLTSLTFAVAALAMARRGALAQQLNAVESLASVDVICLDKTGTLTEPHLRVVEAVPANGDRRRCNASSAASPLHSRPATQPSRRSRTPTTRLSSSRGDRSVLVAVPLERRPPRRHHLRARRARALPARLARRPRRGGGGRGRRVLALASTQEPLGGRDPGEGPPPGLSLHGLVLLAERLRDDAVETVRFFLDQGVELKVLSGDRPATVAAIAADAGIPVGGGPIDGESLPDDPPRCARLRSPRRS